MIKGSQHIREKIKVYEGYSETPKRDTDGNFILGYGVQVNPKERNKIDLTQAEKDLDDRMNLASEEMAPLINRPLTQEQQDALVDMHFNMGLTKMVKHGVFHSVNSGNDFATAELFKRLNKAKLVDTGKMEAVGNLPERADYRAELWTKHLGNQPTAMAQEEQAPEEGTGLNDLVAEVQQYEPAPSEDTGLNPEQLIAEVESVNRPTGVPGAGFDIATDISNPAELETQKKVSAISKKYNVPADVVEGMLLTEDEDTVTTKLAASETKSKYPGTTKWASKPENNALLKKTKDYPKKIERVATKLNEKKPDWQKAIDSNFLRLEESAVIGQMIYGSIGKQEGIAKLRQIDEAKKANVIETPEMQAIKESLAKVGGTFLEGWNDIKAVPIGEDTTKNLVNIIKAMANAGINTGEDAAAFIFMAAKNPNAYAQFMTESAGAPIAAGVVGSVAGTPLVGAAAAYSTGALVAFGGKAREDMEKFRNPKTGEIDYDAFMADPERIAKLRLEATTYGLTIGAVETAFQFLGGRFISKAIPKNPVMGTIATGAGGTVVEGAGETIARTAGQAVSGQEITMGENIAEGLMEAGAAGPMTGAGAVLQTIINRKGTVKTTENIQKSSKANEDVNSLSELKETLKQDTAAVDYPDQVADLVDTVSEIVTQVKEPVTSEFEVEIEPKDTAVEAQVNYIREKAKAGTITFTPSEWEAFNAMRGVDPFEALGVFSPATQAAYSTNRESDTSITIPVSEWALATEEDPDIDQIVRINGNDFNNLEANELIAEFEKNPLVFFDTDQNSTDMEEVADATIDNPTQIETVEGDGSTPMRPLDLTSPFASIEEQEAFEGFKRRLNRALPDSIQPELADDIANIQLRHLRLRSAVSGIPLSDTLERLQFGRRLSEGKSRATMPTFEKDFFTVAFNKHDGAQSVIHELAHVWLHEMAEDFQLLKDIDLSSAHGDIQAYREAMDTVKELLGLESLDELLTSENTAKLTRLQETFAQTAEDYFMEGKSENSRIRRAMERMRTWLAKHINKLRNLSRKYPTLNINPKTEFVFDAILAATNASEDQVYAMFPDPMFNSEELGPGAPAYLKALYDSRSQALTEVYGKAFTKKGLKENERIFETGYDRISKEVEAEIDSLPSMILRAQMFDVYKEYKEAGSKGQDPRISYESAQEYLTDGSEEAIAELKKQVPYFMMTGKKKGGLSVPDLMNMIGVNSAETLREMLLEAAQREAIIQEEIEAKLQTEVEPFIKSEDEMHKIAEEAVNGEGREKIIKEEFKILMQMYPAQFVRATSGLIQTPESLDKVTRDVYKAQASLQVGSTPAAGFSAENFLRDMNLQRRKATKAYRAKDFEKAIGHKVNEAKAYYAYREAIKAEKAMARARVQVKNLEKVVKNVALFKNTYDYGVVEFAVKTVGAVRAGETVEPLTHETLPEGVRISQTAMDVITEALSKLVGEPGGKNITVNGAVSLGEAVKAMLRAARETKKLDLEDASINLDEAVAADLEKMGEGNVVPFKLAGQEGTSIFAAAKTSNTKLRAALDQMYKSTEEFAVSNLGKIFAWIGSAEAAMDIEKRELRAGLRQAMNKFPKSKSETLISSDRYEWMPFIDKTSSPIFWDNAKFKFENMGEVITAMMYMGSESGAKKFLYGKGLANTANFNVVVQDFWDMIQDKFDKKVISKEHIEFVDKAWETLSALHPRIKQVLYETEGFPMGKIDGWEVNTPIGKLKGGYFPVVHAKQISVDDFTKLLDGGTNLMDWVKAFPSKDTKMAMDRTEFYGDVNLNLNALNAYVEAAMNVIHLRKPMMSFSKFVAHPSFAATLETRRPGLYDNMIKPWMERVKLQSFIDPASKFNGLNPVLKMMRQNTGISFFFLNFASMFRQTLGTFQALPEVGPKYIALSAANFSLSPLTHFRRATELSSMMKDRVFTSQTKFVTSVEDLNKANDLLAKSKEITEKVTYIPLQAFQAVTDILVWNAAYDKMLSKDKTSKEAVAYADMVVKKSQGSSNITEMTNLQYGSEFTKFFTQFSTVPLINYELVMEPKRRGMSTPQALWATSAALSVAVIMPMMIDILITQGIFGEDEDEDKETLAELMLKRGTGATLESFAPTVGKFAGGLISYRKPTLSPSVRKVEDNTAKAVKGLQEWSTYDVEMTPSQVRGVAELLTILTGRPFSFYGKLEMYNYNNLSENEKRQSEMKRRIQRRRAKIERGEYRGR